MQELVPILCILGLSTVFAIAAVIAGFLVSPKTNRQQKNFPYECGMLQFNSKNIEYNPQFLVFAILFLVFDIETVLLFPFASAFDKLGVMAFFEVLVFILILLIGLVYAIKKNFLEWR